MFRTLYSFGLFLVLLVPEPATFALIVFLAVCLMLATLRSVPGLLLSGFGGGMPEIAHTPADS